MIICMFTNFPVGYYEDISFICSIILHLKKICFLQTREYIWTFELHIFLSHLVKVIMDSANKLPWHYWDNVPLALCENIATQFIQKKKKRHFSNNEKVNFDVIWNSARWKKIQGHWRRDGQEVVARAKDVVKAMVVEACLPRFHCLLALPNVKHLLNRPPRVQECLMGQGVSPWAVGGH